jgi:hypothetical protein
MKERIRQEVSTGDTSAANEDAVNRLNTEALRDRNLREAQSTEALEIRYNVGLALCDYLRMCINDGGARRLPRAAELLEAVLKLQRLGGHDPGSLPR